MAEVAAEPVVVVPAPQGAEAGVTKPIDWPPAWPAVAQLKLKPLTKPRLVSVSANSMPIRAPMKPMCECSGSSTHISLATSVWCMRLRPT